MRKLHQRGGRAASGAVHGGTRTTARSWLRPLIGLAACCVVAAPTWAQQTTYTCRDERGTVYTLFYPCPKGTKTTSASVGPTERPSRSDTSRDRSYNAPAYVSPPPEYHRYMSARCRNLNDAQRNGSSANIPYDVAARMRSEYERDCREEESAASMRLYKEQRDARKSREDAQRQAAAAEQESEEQAVRRMRQCAESHRILAAKKARTDLTQGEMNDLRRFEETVASRCPR